MKSARLQALLWLSLLLVIRLISSARAAPGDVEPDFIPDPNNMVTCTALQPDGKIVIGGFFNAVWGLARNYFARLNQDGTLDASFSPNVGNAVFCTAVQEDGKIVIGGNFTNVAEVPRNHIARLNANGTLDVGFNPNVGGAVVYTIAVQLDGKIVIGGVFTNVDGATRSNVARLNTDGKLDTGFNANTDEIVYGTLLQADGKIVIGGNFNTVGEIARSRLARLKADGTVDTDFDARATGSVFCFAVQPDGKIVIGGGFTTMNGLARSGLARLNADGTLDPNFSPNVASSILPGPVVNSTALQTDEKIVIGGEFSTVGGTTRRRIARLNPDGSLDKSFNPSSLGTVFGTLLQADGKVIIGGVTGSTVNGGTRQSMGRLLNDVATQGLTVPGASRVEWLRGGASPEALDVSFELSIDDGTTWSSLGAGTRIPGGWELTGLGLPASGRVRASARVTGGLYNGSSGLVQTLTAYSFVSEPSPRLVGATILNGAFRVGFTYQSGVLFTALATTNLTLPTSNWTVLGPATEIFPGQFQFTDFTATNSPNRFYQIRSP